ncbi:MAG: hypothetical protein ACFE9T_03860 [Promethearchaeota archaeon]
MNLTPERICKEFQNNKLDKYTAFELLISLIENSEDENLRIESIKSLEKVGIFNERTFSMMENILISDSNADLRNIAAKVIQKKFSNEKALIPLGWAIKYENNYCCQITMLKTIEKINSKEAKAVLINQLKKIKKIKYMNKDKNIENKRYKKTLKKLFKERKFEHFTNKELAEVIINYLTIQNLIYKFANVFYELDPQTALIKELDLSDYMEYEVKGTPWGWKNNIKTLSDIPGLSNLKKLEKIDLSYNQINDIKDLIQLLNLRQVILVNNKINDSENINYLKSLPNLEYLDLRGNNIAKNIKLDEFKTPKLRLILNNSYIKIK